MQLILIMISKKSKLKLTTKIDNKIAITSVAIVIITTISLIIASLLTPSIAGNFSIKPSTAPQQGWCVTNTGIIGTNGKHTTRGVCTYLEYDNDPNTNWYAFCPDIAGQGERDEDSCKCGATDIEKSSALIERINMRSGLIEALNDGEFSQQDSNNMLKFLIAPALNCACNVYNAGTAPTGDKAKYKITSINVAGVKIDGVHTFIRKVAKMFSKMYSPAPNCQLLPQDCKIGRSYDRDRSEDFILEAYRNDPNASPHQTGQALDMNCQEFATEATNQCDPTTKELLDKVRGSASSLNIMQECSFKERGCWGTQDSSATADQKLIEVIHVDEKKRNDDDPDVEACLYTDCDVTNCQNITE